MDDKFWNEIKKAENDGCWGKDYYGFNYWAAEANKRAKEANSFNFAANHGPAIPQHPLKKLATILQCIGILSVLPALFANRVEQIIYIVFGALFFISGTCIKIVNRRIFANYKPSIPIKNGESEDKINHSEIFEENFESISVLPDYNALKPHFPERLSATIKTNLEDAKSKNNGFDNENHSSSLSSTSPQYPNVQYNITP